MNPDYFKAIEKINNVYNASIDIDKKAKSLIDQRFKMFESHYSTIKKKNSNKSSLTLTLQDLSISEIFARSLKYKPINPIMRLKRFSTNAEFLKNIEENITTITLSNDATLFRDEKMVLFAATVYTLGKEFKEFNRFKPTFDTEQIEKINALFELRNALLELNNENEYYLLKKYSIADTFVNNNNIELFDTEEILHISFDSKRKFLKDFDTNIQNPYDIILHRMFQIVAHTASKPMDIIQFPELYTSIKNVKSISMLKKDIM